MSINHSLRVRVLVDILIDYAYKTIQDYIKGCRSLTHRTETEAASHQELYELLFLEPF